MPNAFSVHLASNHADPGFSQARTRGLKLANAFGVLFQIFKLAHYRNHPEITQMISELFDL
jgi:hypothetical protein